MKSSTASSSATAISSANSTLNAIRREVFNFLNSKRQKTNKSSICVSATDMWTWLLETCPGLAESHYRASILKKYGEERMSEFNELYGTEFTMQYDIKRGRKRNDEIAHVSTADELTVSPAVTASQPKKTAPVLKLASPSSPVGISKTTKAKETLQRPRRNRISTRLSYKEESDTETEDEEPQDMQEEEQEQAVSTITSNKDKDAYTKRRSRVEPGTLEPQAPKEPVAIEPPMKKKVAPLLATPSMQPQPMYLPVPAPVSAPLVQPQVMRFSVQAQLPYVQPVPTVPAPALQHFLPAFEEPALPWIEPSPASYEYEEPCSSIMNMDFLFENQVSYSSCAPRQSYPQAQSALPARQQQLPFGIDFGDMQSSDEYTGIIPPFAF